MPPSSTPQRRSSRRIKVESEGDSTTATLSSLSAAAADVDSLTRSRQVENEDGRNSSTTLAAQNRDFIQSIESENSPALENSAGTAQSSIPSEATKTLEAAPSTSQSRTRGTAPAKRFQTRTGIVRKSEADRKKLEQEEAERRQRRAQETTRGQRVAQRGMRGNQRGSERGRGVSAFDARTGTTGTSWAIDRPPSNSARGQVGNERIISEDSDANRASLGKAQNTDENIFTEADHLGPASKGKGRASTISQAESVHETIEHDGVDGGRTDIDQINLISSDEGDDGPVLSRNGRSQKRLARGNSLRPIRLEKHEHVKRAVGIEATKLKTERNIKSETFEQPAEVLRKAEAIAITEAEDAMQHDPLPADESPPCGSKKEVGIKLQPSSPEQSKAKIERKRRPSSKESRLAHETLEEQQERTRYERELGKIKHELGSLAHISTDTSEIPPSTFSETDAAFASDRKIYLFQLPPMIPMLKSPPDLQPASIQPQAHPKTTTTAAAAAGTNKSQSSEIKREIIDLTNQDTTGPSSSTADTQHQEKQEPPPTAPPEFLTATTDPHHLPPTGGLIGTLNVHQSGKVTLDWGGTPMCVNWGSEVDFLQDAVLAVPVGRGDRDGGSADELGEPGNPSNPRNASGGESTNNVYHLGGIGGKFVVVPDWRRIYE